MGELTRDELLILLVEECGEVIQAATKCLRFGWDVDHGVGYGLNSAVLSKECGDLQAVMDALPLCHIAKESTRIRKIAKAQLAKDRYGRPSPRGER
jgi:NTP pyrophosphatase (non-canonical NTP hydrolase)